MSNNIDQYAKVKLGGGNEFMGKGSLEFINWAKNVQQLLPAKSRWVLGPPRPRTTSTYPTRASITST